ncbi:MAG TPA: hypothetical protein VFB82_16595, partial [Blastocatellia bacterium]|nr:hypothetical protein [Blastocatellia bacterium]
AAAKQRFWRSVFDDSKAGTRKLTHGHLPQRGRLSSARSLPRVAMLSHSLFRRTARKPRTH